MSGEPKLPKRPTLRPSRLPDCGRLRASRIFSRIVLGVLLLFIGGATVAPWTQNVRGMGRVIAYSPSARETPIKAPIYGQVLRWHVAEGEHVTKGQLIAELADNDAQILDRLGRARDAVEVKSNALVSAVRVAQDQVRALEQSRDASIDKARQEVAIASAERDAKQQEVLASKATLETARINLKRLRNLNSQDLISDRDLELGELAVRTAKNELASKRAAMRAAERKMQAASATLDEVRTSKQAYVEKAKGELEKLRGEVGENAAKVADAEVKLSRQQQMRIVAPRDGTILSVVAREGSDFLKVGDTLATFVPETTDRAIELWVDGNDAPLINKGRSVRLQFEGWPAVQFVGWPSVAVGTFGGEVAFVDRAARKDGKFRVVVLPDPDDEPWPNPQYLRQGVQVKGWILLNRVTVAYEMWRQLNGFPPAIEEGFVAGSKTKK